MDVAKQSVIALESDTKEPFYDCGSSDFYEI